MQTVAHPDERIVEKAEEGVGEPRHRGMAHEQLHEPGGDAARKSGSAGDCVKIAEAVCEELLKSLDPALARRVCDDARRKPVVAYPV